MTHEIGPLSKQPHLLGEHPKLLEVDEAVDVALVAQVDERQVLVDHRIDRDDRRPRVGDEVAVTPEVHRRVHEGEHVGQRPGVLDRNLVPGGLEPADDDVVEAGDDGKHGVEVLSLFVAVLGDLEMKIVSITS